MSVGGFLARWSRRKREAGKAIRQPEPGEETSAVVSRPSQPVEWQDGAAVQLSAAELAGLPRAEDLTPTSDLTQFLRDGVPAALRNAALRRIWALDPAIRDFVGDARDYAYDWNTPGGVPGSGPLLAADDAEGMLRRIINERETQPSGEAKDNAPVDSARANSAPADSAERSAEAGEATRESQPAVTPISAMPTRHHGGAMPD